MQLSLSGLFKPLNLQKIIFDHKVNWFHAKMDLYSQLT